MTNCRQSEILFLDVKMKNTPIIQFASKNSPSNRPRHVLIYTPLIHWRPGGTELYVLNSITTIAIVSQQYHNYRNSITIVSQQYHNYRNSITTIAIVSQQYHNYRNSITIVSQLSQQYHNYRNNIAIVLPTITIVKISSIVTANKHRVYEILKNVSVFKSAAVQLSIGVRIVGYWTARQPIRLRESDGYRTTKK